MCAGEWTVGVHGAHHLCQVSSTVPSPENREWQMRQSTTMSRLNNPETRPRQRALISRWMSWRYRPDATSSYIKTGRAGVPRREMRSYLTCFERCVVRRNFLREKQMNRLIQVLISRTDRTIVVRKTSPQKMREEGDGASICAM